MAVPVAQKGGTFAEAAPAVPARVWLLHRVRPLVAH